MPTPAHTIIDTCRVPLRTINLFVLNKHFLLDHAAHNTSMEVAERLTGLHNKRPQTPYLSIYARLPTVTPAQLDKLIYTQRTLLRAHCMRGTVHLLPLSRYQTVLTATKGQLDGMYRRAFAHLPDKPQITAAILATISTHGPLSRSEIAAALPMKVDERDLYRLINELCTLGELIKTTVQGSWRSTAYKYELLSRWQPAIPAGISDQLAAREQLVLWYLSTYGPATLADIAWWTGLSQAQTRQALNRCAEDWVYIHFEALGAAAYLLRDQFAHLSRWHASPKPQVKLVPSFDPYIMGYSARDRYIDQDFYSRVFKGVSGIIEPVVLVDGRIVGSWKYTLHKGQLNMELFQELQDLSIQHELTQQTEAMVDFLIRADAEGGAGEQEDDEE